MLDGARHFAFLHSDRRKKQAARDAKPVAAGGGRIIQHAASVAACEDSRRSFSEHASTPDGGYPSCVLISRDATSGRSLAS
jgi:hypothetical protein